MNEGFASLNMESEILLLYLQEQISAMCVVCGQVIVTFNPVQSKQACAEIQEQCIYTSILLLNSALNDAKLFICDSIGLLRSNIKNQHFVIFLQGENI